MSELRFNIYGTDDGYCARVCFRVPSIKDGTYTITFVCPECGDETQTMLSTNEMKAFYKGLGNALQLPESEDKG